MSITVSKALTSGGDPYGPSTYTDNGTRHSWSAASLKHFVKPCLALIRNTSSFSVLVFPPPTSSFEPASVELIGQVDGILAMVNGWASNGIRDIPGMVMYAFWPARHVILRFRMRRTMVGEMSSAVASIEVEVGQYSWLFQIVRRVRRNRSRAQRTNEGMRYGPKLPIRTHLSLRTVEKA